MKKVFTAFLLAMACVAGTTAALADNKQVRGASATYKWSVHGDEESTIYRAEGGRCSSWVIVYVDGDSHEHHGNCHGGDDRGRHQSEGVVVRNCGNEEEVHILPGEGRKCLVRPGRDLKLRICGDDFDKHAHGTWQEVHI